MLTDPKAAKVRGVAKLAKKDARSETGLFLLEGPQGFREALDRPKLILEAYATEEFLARHADLAAAAKAKRIDITLVDERVLASLSDTTTPQGILAVCHQLHVSIEEVLAGQPKLIAVLSQIRDPGNAGTVLRAADAAGADAVIFSTGSVDVYNPKVVRSTTGSLFHLPIVIDQDVAALASVLKAGGASVFDNNHFFASNIWAFNLTAHAVRFSRLANNEGIDAAATGGSLMHDCSANRVGTHGQATGRNKILDFCCI